MTFQNTAAGHTGDPAGAAGDRPRTESPRPPGAAGCGRLAPGGRRLTSRGARAGPQGPPPLSAPSYRSSCGPRQLVSSGGSRSCGRVVTRGRVRGGVAATVASPHAASTRVPAAACARRAAPNRCVLRARLSFNAPGYFVLRIPAPRNRKVLAERGARPAPPPRARVKGGGACGRPQVVRLHLWIRKIRSKFQELRRELRRSAAGL